MKLHDIDMHSNGAAESVHFCLLCPLEPLLEVDVVVLQSSPRIHFLFICHFWVGLLNPHDFLMCGRRFTRKKWRSLSVRGYALRKMDLGRGPTDPSPRTTGGLTATHRLFHDPLRVGQQSLGDRNNLGIGCPTRKGSWIMVALFTPIHRLYEPRMGARIHQTSHEGRSFIVRLFLMRNPCLIFRVPLLNGDAELCTTCTRIEGDLLLGGENGLGL